MAGRDKTGFANKPGRGSDTLQVLIVDDSVVVRRIMSKVFEEDSRFTVASAVASGERAVEFAHNHHVDLVLLDMNLPGEDGLSVLGKILNHDRQTQVVLLSASLREGSDIALKALAMECQRCDHKARGWPFQPLLHRTFRDRLHHLTPAARRSSHARAGRRDRSAAPPPRNGRTRRRHRRLDRRHRIGDGCDGRLQGSRAGSNLRHPASSRQLPAALRRATAPRHAPADRHRRRRNRGKAGHGLYCARHGASLALSQRHRPHHDQAQQEACLHGGLPAVDPMFRALANIYGAGACGIILSGMGRDGLAGAQAIAEAGGWLIAQDHVTSAVWGMPGSVAKAGLASAILPPTAIAQTILQQRQAAA